jgi:hypothetical protein
MTFAFWQELAGTGAEVQTKASTPGRGLHPVEHHVVILFVVEIPTGVTREDVIEQRLARDIRSASPMAWGLETNGQRT